MKAIATLAFGIVSSLGACISAASVASIVMAHSEGHSFGRLSAPDLWTTNPVRIDRSKQDYQRLPPAYSSYVTDAPKVVLATRKPNRNPEATAGKLPVLSAAHLNWCAGRYRSFDRATNNYRTYSGQIRTCVSPYTTPQPTEADVTMVSEARGGNSKAAWCAAHYQSYREQDNTYQPYEGQRRDCEIRSAAEIASAGNLGDPRRK
jgi:hypothetical protein